MKGNDTMIFYLMWSFFRVGYRVKIVSKENTLADPIATYRDFPAEFGIFTNVKFQYDN